MVVLPTPPLPTMPTFTAIPPSMNTYESGTYVGQGTTPTTTDQRSVPGARVCLRLDAAQRSPVSCPPSPSRAPPTRGRLHVDESAHGGCPGIGRAARAPHRSGGQRGVAPQIDGADGPTLATEVLRLMPHRLRGQALRRHNSPRVHGTAPLPSGNARTSRRSLNVSRPAADTPIPVPDQ